MNTQNLLELMARKKRIAAALAAGFSPDEIFIMLRNEGMMVTPSRVRVFCDVIYTTNTLRRWRIR